MKTVEAGEVRIFQCILDFEGVQLESLSPPSHTGTCSNGILQTENRAVSPYLPLVAKAPPKSRSVNFVFFGQNRFVARTTAQ